LIVLWPAEEGAHVAGRRPWRPSAR